MEELRAWTGYKAFQRARREPKQVILTSRFVAKWKWVERPDGTSARIIRMRLVFRGSEDHFAFERDNYSGTASRQTQRLINSEVACRPSWVLVTIDVEKAFLQGLAT